MLILSHTGTDPLWVRRALAALPNRHQTTLSPHEWSGGVQVGTVGANGDDGSNGATLFLYQRTTSNVAPAQPTQDSTYTFATTTLAPGVQGGWSTVLPAFNDTTDNGFIWVVAASVASPNATVMIPASMWSMAALLSQRGDQGEQGIPGVNGIDGTDGNTTALLSIYRRAAAQPTTPVGGSFDFDTRTLTPPTDWFRVVPTGTDPVWTTNAIATIVGTTGTDTTLTWQQPDELVRNGVDGMNGMDGSDGQIGPDGFSYFEAFIFQRSATQPPRPNGGTFNFGNNLLVPPAGWSARIPSGDDPLYAANFIFSTQGATGVETAMNWTFPVIFAQDGEQGEFGNSVYQASIYMRATTAPSAPTGGSFNFGTNVLTPPSGWSNGIPSGTDPVYQATGIFSISRDYRCR